MLQRFTSALRHTFSRNLSVHRLISAAKCKCSTIPSQSNMNDLVEPEDICLEKLGISIHPQFISETEHDSLVAELLPILAKRRYQTSHWDHVISQFRELEKVQWSETNQKILARVKQVFPPSTPWLPAVHVLDLAEDGYIGAHVDSRKFSGGIVSGLCLLSPAIMVLTHDTERSAPPIKLFLAPRTLYILSGPSRYDYAHAIPSNADKVTFRGQLVHRTRRISLMFRDELHGTPASGTGTGRYARS